jgi:DNA polymerase family A/3'-5' exonuclease
MIEYDNFLMAESVIDLHPFLNDYVKYISFDIETYIKPERMLFLKNGKPAKKQPMHNPRNAKPRLLQFYNAKAYDKPVICDLKKVKGVTPFMQQLFSDENKEIFAFNAMFDGTFVYSYFKVLPVNLVCSRVMTIIFYAGLKKAIEDTYKSKKINNLASVYARLFPLEPILNKEEQSSDWSGSLSLSQLSYAAMDVIANDKIFRRLRPAIMQEVNGRSLETVYQAERRKLVAFIVASCEGFPVDPLVVAEVKQSYIDAVERIEAKLQRLFKTPGLNPNSPAQVKEALNKHGLAVESTGVGALANYQGNPLVDTLLLYKSVNTGLSHIKTLESCIDPDTGCIHGGFTSAAPRGTGRSSCQKFNLQNVPRLATSWKKVGCLPIRTVFQHPDKSYKVISVDSSGCHVQIAREYSQDQELKRITREGLDPYIILGCKIQELRNDPVDYNEIKKIVKDKNHPDNFYWVDQRQIWKKTFLSRLNLASAKKIQAGLAENDPPIFVDLETCELAVKAWDTLFEGLAKFQRRAVQEANLNENINPFHLYQNYSPYQDDPDAPKINLRTNQFGLIFALDGGYYFLPKTLSYGKNSVTPTDCVAFLWQRVEGTCIGNSGYDVVKYCWDKGYIQDKKAWLCNINHDEHVLIAHESIAEEMAKVTAQAMIDRFQEFIPDYGMKDDPIDGILNNWNEKV